MRLTISTLGSFQVSLNKQSVASFRFKRAWALLAYLAVEMGTVHNRSLLANLLWPDELPQIASQNLRQALATLRRSLGDRKNKNPFLIITPNTVQFNPASTCSLDFIDFVHLLNTTNIHQHRRMGACSICVARLHKAIRLYQGDFLADFLINSEPFEIWARNKREQLHIMVMQGLGILTQYHLLCHEYDEATQLALKQLVLDQLSVVGHHQLLQILVTSGRRHAALTHYENYRTLLADELSIAPPVRTIDLYKEILDDNWETKTAIPLPPNNLPAQIMPFVGYKEELRLITERLASVECRLLTLTGPGGCGKSRLALQSAWNEIAHFQHGIYFVDLQGTADGDLLEIIASTLPLSYSSNKPLLRQLGNWLRDKEVLLVLDNFEGWVAQAALLVDLLQTAAKLNILVTSREWLKVREETILQIKGLSFPIKPVVGEVGQYEAVQLFIQKVRQQQPDFTLQTPENYEAMVGLCRIVGGLPLALEMASSWINILSLPELVVRVATDYDFLSSSLNLPQRHCSLKNMFDASWQQLSVREQQAIGRLSVFNGRFNLKAAESIAQVSPVELLALHTKSFLYCVRTTSTPTVLNGSEPNLADLFYEIPELFRLYVIRLQAQQILSIQQIHQAHCLYYLRILHEAINRVAKNFSQMPQALRIIDTNFRNIWQAFQWANEHKLDEIQDRGQQDLTLFYILDAWCKRKKAVV